MENIQIASYIIILTTLFKVIYDIYISRFFFKKNYKKNKVISEAVKSKKNTDVSITLIVLCIITLTSIFSVKESMMANEMSGTEFTELTNKVQLLESRIEILEGPLFPNGGGPNSGPNGGPGGTPVTLKKILEDLYEKLNAVQANFVTKSEFDKIIIEVAELKNPPVATDQKIYKSIRATPIKVEKGSEASG